MRNGKNHRNTTWNVICTLLTALLVLGVAGQSVAQDQGYDQGEQSYESQENQGQQSYDSQEGGSGQGQTGYEEPESAGQSKDYSEETLEKFAKSYNQVYEIRQEYSSELSEMEDEEKAKELQEKYTDRMVEAVEDEGLSVEKYNEIGQAMNNDEELSKKVESMVDEMQ
ncbi:MAG: DUF4168 domain-containing protein [Thermodesulfobacteriota bacterium]